MNRDEMKAQAYLERIMELTQANAELRVEVTLLVEELTRVKEEQLSVTSQEANLDFKE